MLWQDHSSDREKGKAFVRTELAVPNQFPGTIVRGWSGICRDFRFVQGSVSG